jgi:hypothetical protein
VKREHHLSAQISHNKSKIAYILQGEKRAPFVSPDLTQQIQDQLTSSCKVKREHHLSAQISHNNSKITYKLQGEKRAPFVSPDLTQQIQDCLLAAR